MPRSVNQFNALRATTPEWLALAAAGYLVLFCNTRFWDEFLASLTLATASDVAFLASVPVTLTSLFFMVLLVIGFRHTIKPVLGLIFLANSVVLYFMDTYHVYLDRSMIRNALQTDVREAGELLSPTLLVYVLLYGVLPCAALALVRFRKESVPRAMVRRAVMFTAAGLVAVASVAGLFQQYLSVARGHRELRHLLTPGNYLNALAQNIGISAAHAGPALRIPVGADARLAAAAWQAGRKPALVVLVLGEAARAEEFSLNGYARDTNPFLRQSSVFNFSNVHSCGTSTAESLPCMFSPFGRDGPDAETARDYESLLDVVRHAGFRVLWLDNNSGCKGVCAGVETRQLNQDAASELCADGACYDEILLEALARTVAAPAGNLFIVLHQQGSHGPAYFRRYPPRFERFSPVCRAAELRDCTAAEVRNAYDDTILYTDYVLSRVIETLSAQSSRYDTAMLYMSDHGESLGEGGLYLHGMPYAIAPEAQTHVPFLFWMSEDFGKAFAVDRECLAGEARNAYSHDHLFHSVLGLLEVRTAVYRRPLDVFAACRKKGSDLQV